MIIFDGKHCEVCGGKCGVFVCPACLAFDYAEQQLHRYDDADEREGRHSKYDDEFTRQPEYLR